MTDLSVEEFDLHPSFNDTVWPAQIGDRTWRNKATTWLIIFGCLIILGMIFALFNGNVQQLEFLEKLEKNVQETINSAFENKHRVIANEIEGIINESINDKMEHHFSKLVQLLHCHHCCHGYRTHPDYRQTLGNVQNRFAEEHTQNAMELSDILEIENPMPYEAEGLIGVWPEAPMVLPEGVELVGEGPEPEIIWIEGGEVAPVVGVEGEVPVVGAEGAVLVENGEESYSDYEEQQAAPRAARAARAAPFVAQAAAVEPAGLVWEEAEGGAEGVALAAQAAVVEPVGLVGEEAEGGEAGVALAAQAAVVEPAGLVGEEAEGGAAVEAGPLGRKVGQPLHLPPPPPAHYIRQPMPPPPPQQQHFGQPPLPLRLPIFCHLVPCGAEDQLIRAGLLSMSEHHVWASAPSMQEMRVTPDIVLREFEKVQQSWRAADLLCEQLSIIVTTYSSPKK
ncbi:hypothetical protein GPALN_014402 [Globodera pallida]|nr:hypothetical protein GPALN_014402 [Globodera pallida]